ncbi:MAG: calcium-binding protein [Rhizobiaceae bacterium]|nr:calcium-binding protein [Rhizobiaceae bacterium]
MPQTPTVWRGSTLVNPLTNGFQGQSKIIGLSNGNILVVYADDSATAPTAGRDVSGVIYDATGAIVRAAFQLNTIHFADTEELPSVAATNDGGFVMAYLDTNASGSSVRTERYDADGDSIDAGAAYVDNSAAIVGNPSIAVNTADNSFFVTYEHKSGTNETIRGRKLDAALNTVGEEKIVRADDDPDTAGVGNFTSDTAVLANGAYVTVYERAAAGFFESVKNIDVTLSTTAGTTDDTIEVDGESIDDHVFAPKIAALPDGGFVVVWVKAETTEGESNDNILYRIYDADGKARTGVLTAVDSTSDHALPDVIGLKDNTFFIAWDDKTEGDIEGRLYNATTGAAIGSAINIQTTDDPRNLNLGATTDGRILVTYQTLTPGDDVKFEIFDPRSGTITAEPGEGQVTARTEGSTLIGSTSAERLIGRNGDDTFIYPHASVGAGNIDKIEGGGGTNTFSITALPGQMIVDLKAGIFASGNAEQALTVRATLSQIQNVTVAGAQDVRGSDGINFITATGAFNNTLLGLGGADTLKGGGGDDHLDGGTGVDTLEGGDGSDTYVVDDPDEVVVEAAGKGALDVVRTSGSYALPANAEIERLETTNALGIEAITLVGNQFKQTIVGNDGENQMLGDGPNGGADTLEGRGGNDTYYITNAAMVVIEEAGKGALDRVVALVDYALSAGAHVERMEANALVIPTARSLKGNALAQELIGHAGKDVLDDGGAGKADTLSGLGGDDTYVVNNSGDVIVEAADQGLDSVLTNVTFDLLEGVHVELLRAAHPGATTAINLFGNTLKQEVHGNDGSNIISDGGKGSADVLVGRGGNDTYRIYNSGDLIKESSTQGAADTVLAAVDYTLGTSVHVEVLATLDPAGAAPLALFGNEFGQTITGNKGANVLRGYDGDDTINGGDGADKISGGLGNDTLAGNVGADTYYFSYALNGTTNVDTIKGFSSIDLISLNASIFAQAGPAGALAASAFAASADGKATTAAHRITYETDTGILRYDSDGTGAAAAVAFAIMQGLPSMNAGDFVVA